MDRLAVLKEQEEDATSNFSFTKSDNLNLVQPDIELKPCTSIPEAKNSEISSGRSIDNTYEKPMDYASSKTDSTSASQETINSNKEAAVLGPPSIPGKRASMVSQLSDYSGKGNHIAQPVSVKVVNQELNPSVSKKYYRVDETDDKEDPDLADSISTVHDDSIKVGKLNTTSVTSSKRLGPDMTFSTNIESSVPPRSSRRPKSEILLTTNELDEDIEKFKNNKIKSHSKHSSIAISDDLDKLMESANSITLQLYVFKNVDDKIEYQEKKPHESDYQESEAPENRTVSTPIGENQDGARSSNSFISRAASNRTNDSYTTANILATEAADGRLQKSSLPPRPTADNIQRARHVSSQVSEQQKLSNESQDPSEATESPRGTPIASQDPEDEYYDIDDNEVLEQPSRGKSVKDSTRSMKKIKHKKAKAKRVKSLSTQGLKPFSYHTLINLLESTNGTIIGEEFDQLNLPIKEKQLIEKIVDSLSRLTSDMVLDEARYDAGITRLEKAHRALEGFL